MRAPDCGACVPAAKSALLQLEYVCSNNLDFVRCGAERSADTRCDVDTTLKALRVNK